MPARSRSRSRRQSGDTMIKGDQEPHVDPEKGDKKDEKNKLDIWGDLWALGFLLMLYTVQGIPMGLAGAVPLLLQKTGLGFGAKAVFSFATWPYSFKLLWAPIVDALWLDRFGRRKTWVVPTQLLAGVSMILLGPWLDRTLESALEDPDRASELVLTLTWAFFLLYVLAATQDIAVDGWALTVLRPQNRGLASVCNSVGLIFGSHLSGSLLLVLSDRESSRSLSWIAEAGPSGVLMSAGSFLAFWGWVFVGVTICIALFVTEKPTPREHGDDEPWYMPVVTTYRQMVQVLRLPEVQVFAALLLTCRVGFAAMDSGVDVELAQRGVGTSFFAGMSVYMAPLEVVSAVALGHFLRGPHPLRLWLRAYIPRIALGALLLGLINLLPDFPIPQGPWHRHPWLYPAITSTILALRLSSSIMFVSLMGFFSKIADPKIGGTFMTLLNTIANLGGSWPSPVALQTMELLEHRGCYTHSSSWKVQAHDDIPLSQTRANIAEMQMNKLGREAPTPLHHATCANASAVIDCEAKNGFCYETSDGFTIVALACMVLAVLWIVIAWNPMKRIEQAPRSKWTV